MSVTVNTPDDQERYSELDISDIESLAAFRAWAGDKLIFYAGGEVPEEHLLIYVTYIKGRIDESDAVDRLMWKKAIVALENRLGGQSEF